MVCWRGKKEARERSLCVRERERERGRERERERRERRSRSTTTIERNDANLLSLTISLTFGPFSGAACAISGEKPSTPCVCEGKNTLAQGREKRENGERGKKTKEKMASDFLVTFSSGFCSPSILKQTQVHVKSYARPAPPPGLEGGPASRRRRALKELQACCRRRSASVFRRGPRQGRCGDAEAARGEERRVLSRRRREKGLKKKNSKPMPWCLPRFRASDSDAPVPL